MGSVYNRFSDGPTMILPSSQNHPSFQFPSQSVQGFQAYDSGSWSMDAVYANQFKGPTRHSSSWTPSSSSKTIFTNPSRKRSRNDSEDDDISSSKLSFAPSIPAVEAPIYGEGMVLLNPRTGMAVSAESQTGTWYEEEAVKKTISSRMQQFNNGDGPSRKSQRLDTSASHADDVELAWIQQQMQATTNDDNRRSFGKNSPLDMADEPRVDDVTLLLGISWQRVIHDGDMGPAVSGWEKYINNHFYKYMRNARIILKNRSLNAYLVAALPAQDVPLQDTPMHSNYAAMSKAQLVASTLDNCLRNIRSTPIQFEGFEVLRASERSPERTVVPSDVINCVVGNGIPIARISKEDHAVTGEKVNMNNDMAMSMGTDMDVDL
ncbi:conserved hypothetical protein [Talaromyces stipitatus ATCC 10500]|uniref:Uncharacterized protein n=1 Tax=Talaromyces stipitatus (strain ATCC 10500 / CBS 375.48 / QM 6759 / NRRL 1006) TaxID=441959 RepID=B8M7Y6_TALSN|nr:uncharacterized protein TSTA_031270 [Talaromyces stipitatus ATCC 10500]EED19865.1 conserved hypothetical protein [Talaromyces stipitatus ATCC 10500]